MLAYAPLDQMVALTSKIDNINNNNRNYNNRNNQNRRCESIRVHNGNNRIFTQISQSVATRRESSISKTSKVPTKPSEISTISSKRASLTVPHIIIEWDKAKRIKGAKLEPKNSMDSNVQMDDVEKLFTASREASKFAKATVNSYINGILPVSEKANQPTLELNNLRKASILLQSKPEEKEVDASEMMSDSLPNSK